MPENPGSGGGTPNNTNSGGGAPNNPSTITEDRINEMINAAFAGRDKRTQKQIIESLTAEDSPLMQQISNLGQKLESSHTKSSDTNKSKSKSPNDLPEEAQQKLSEYEQRLEKMQKQLQQREEQIAKAEREKIDQQRKNILKNHLEQQGFKTRAAGVMAQHILDGIVKWDAASDGDVGKPVVEKDGLEIPYQQWLEKEFAKSEIGKSYLDDVGREGSGSGGGDSAVYRGTNTSAFFGGKSPDQMTDEEIAQKFEQSKVG